MNHLVKYSIVTASRMVLLLIGISIFTFLLVTSSPIDPIDAYAGAESNISQEQRENIAEHWGLNKPPLERYFTWVSNLFHGDLGTSITYQKPVSQVLSERFTSSLALMAIAWLFSGILGFSLGILCGYAEGSLVDKSIKTFCFVLSSTPTFWIGLLLLMVFSIQLGWFPMGLSVPIGKAEDEVTLLDRLYHLILPGCQTL